MQQKKYTDIKAIKVSEGKNELSQREINKIEKSVTMIAKNMQPLSIVENAGFLEYSKSLQPLYNLPNRKKQS